MSKKVDFSSPAGAGAIISQFLVALEKCFEMNVNECVYIEKDGDISTNTEQIEYKEYSEKDNLTDSHTNFWNTLKNWLNDDFNSEKYKYLILSTTQKTGSNSSLLNWNQSNPNERKKILNQIHKNAEERYNKKKEEKSDAKKSDSLKLMDKVLGNESKLDKIIDKVIIDDSKLRRDELTTKLTNVHLKFIPDKDKSKVLNSLVGFITIKKENYNKGWEISYTEFSNELRDLATKYNNQSKLFPYNRSLKRIPDSEIKKVSNHTFVKKIKDIDYDSIIHKSMNDYWFTLNTISNEFKGRTQKLDSLELFQDDLLDKHSTLHAKMSRKCEESEIIKKSQDFFDLVIETDTPDFDIYNNTPNIFKNGMYHILADDDNFNLLWKLESKNNE